MIQIQVKHIEDFTTNTKERYHHQSQKCERTCNRESSTYPHQEKITRRKLTSQSHKTQQNMEIQQNGEISNHDKNISKDASMDIITQHVQEKNFRKKLPEKIVILP